MQLLAVDVAPYETFLAILRKWTQQEQVSFRDLGLCLNEKLLDPFESPENYGMEHEVGLQVKEIRWDPEPGWSEWKQVWDAYNQCQTSAPWFTDVGPMTSSSESTSNRWIARMQLSEDPGHRLNVQISKRSDYEQGWV